MNRSALAGRTGAAGGETREPFGLGTLLPVVPTLVLGRPSSVVAVNGVLTARASTTPGLLKSAAVRVGPTPGFNASISIAFCTSAVEGAGRAACSAPGTGGRVGAAGAGCAGCFGAGATGGATGAAGWAGFAMGPDASPTLISIHRRASPSRASSPGCDGSRSPLNTTWTASSTSGRTVVLSTARPGETRSSVSRAVWTSMASTRARSSPSMPFTSLWCRCMMASRLGLSSSVARLRAASRCVSIASRLVKYGQASGWRSATLSHPSVLRAMMASATWAGWLLPVFRSPSRSPLALNSRSIVWSLRATAYSWS